MLSTPFCSERFHWMREKEVTGSMEKTDGRRELWRELINEVTGGKNGEDRQGGSSLLTEKEGREGGVE